jgi:hypothetical protein
MPSLRDRFHQYYAPTEDEIATAMKTGLVAPDTNVLLNLYRYQAGTRDQLFGALEKLGDRLWIPDQVGSEFHNRRLDVMADQEGYFTKTRNEILAAADALYGKVRAFSVRIGVGPDHVKKIEDSISELKELIADEVMKAKGLNDVRLDDHASDNVLARIDALFPTGRVGDPMEPDELEQARAEAARRVTDKIPPGYKDRDKADASGDYLIWRQLMTEAKKRQLPVILITDDAKEDWYQEYKGRTLGARRELREEMMSEAGVSVLFMPTSTFLHHASRHLDAEVSQEAVDQTRELRLQVTANVPPPGESTADETFRDQLFAATLSRELTRHPEHLEHLCDRDRSALRALVQAFRASTAEDLPGNFPDLRQAQTVAIGDALIAMSPAAMKFIKTALQDVTDLQEEITFISGRDEKKPPEQPGTLPPAPAT